MLVKRLRDAAGDEPILEELHIPVRALSLAANPTQSIESCI